MTLEVADPQGDPAEREAIVRVQDTGVGIQPEQLSQIFEFFARGDVSHARRTGGLGVGLSLVKNLVELHRGTIEAYSEGPGKGSEFTLRLPLRFEAKASEPGSAEEPSTSEREHPSDPQRILVIDDNSDVAEALAQLLRDFGHEVQIALSGPDGLKTAAAFAPEVVFVDIGMPGMDGYEVARQLRQQTELKKSKLVALSGYGRAEDRRKS